MLIVKCAPYLRDVARWAQEEDRALQAVGDPLLPLVLSAPRTGTGRPLSCRNARPLLSQLAEALRRLHRFGTRGSALADGVTWDEAAEHARTCVHAHRTCPMYRYTDSLRSARVEVYRDFAPNSFAWTMWRGGKAEMCGGLIYHDIPSDGNHWSIHT